MGGTTSSTTPHVDSSHKHFRVTHPFHPLFGQQFELCRPPKILPSVPPESFQKTRYTTSRNPLNGAAILAVPRLKRLWCSLTSCCDWSGESPDGGRFSVRPSSLTPSAVRQRAAPEAGVTMSSEGVVKCNLTLSRRSQPGGLGKRAGRNIKRTMQPRNDSTRQLLLAETALWLATRLIRRGSLESSCEYNGRTRRTTGVGSATCTESTTSESREGPAGRRGAPAQRRRCV